jgi:glycosyltransferase involved in cell wall biosynthesis
LKIISFTSLFPNTAQKNLGGFIARRMGFWAAQHASNWCIVAPIPFFPRLPFKTPWRVYSKTNTTEMYKKWTVYHPKYLMLPQIGLPIQGSSMATCTTRTLRHIIYEKGPFDLIDAHFVYPDGYAAMKLSRKFNLPLVVSARGSDINSYSQIDGIRPKIQQVLMNADAVIGVSKDLVEKMIALGAPEDRCHLILNGVDTQRFCPGGNTEPKKVVPNLLAVGNLVPEKGFQLLLEAIKILKSEYPDLRLSIVGSGPEESRLRAECSQLGMQDHVTFLGAIPHSEMPEHYRRADTFCLSSLREGCPNVILEALATGIPVVATKVGGVPELVRDGLNGFLANDHSPEAIAHAITQVIERAWIPDEIRSTVANRSWEKVADEIEAVFQKVLSKR